MKILQKKLKLGLCDRIRSKTKCGVVESVTLALDVIESIIRKNDGLYNAIQILQGQIREAEKKSNFFEGQIEPLKVAHELMGIKLGRITKDINSRYQAVEDCNKIQLALPFLNVNGSEEYHLILKQCYAEKKRIDKGLEKIKAMQQEQKQAIHSAKTWQTEIMERTPHAKDPDYLQKLNAVLFCASDMEETFARLDNRFTLIRNQLNLLQNKRDTMELQIKRFSRDQNKSCSEITTYLHSAQRNTEELARYVKMQLILLKHNDQAISNHINGYQEAHVSSMAEMADLGIDVTHLVSEAESYTLPTVEPRPIVVKMPQSPHAASAFVCRSLGPAFSEGPTPIKVTIQAPKMEIETPEKDDLGGW